jgi:outer membrane protein assembly factor BamC
MKLLQTRRGAVATSAQLLLAALSVAMISGCDTVNEVMQPDRIDYKSQAKKGPTLEVPPDLTSVQADRRYAAPDTGTTTLSAYTSTAPKVTTPGSGTENVLPAVSDMRIERDGNQRWLLVKTTPDALWPQLRTFWQELGFLLVIDSPETGIMETDWAENRAKIPQDIIRRTVGKVFDGLYSTSERDKFRTRIEKGPNGTVEVYISHRGAQEQLVGSSKDQTVWTPRPADPELEAEFLSRLMQRLGASKEAAQQKLAQTQAAHPVQDGTKAEPAPRTGPSLLTQSNGQPVLQVPEPFDRAWRTVGLALDRVNFTVDDRDRSQGVYFVRYADTKAEANAPGFFSRLFSGTKIEDLKRAKRYRVVVKDGGASSTVLVQNDDGSAQTGDIGKRILSLLDEQLR